MDVNALESMIRKNHMVLIASSCPPCDADDLVQAALFQIFLQWDKYDASKATRSTWAMMVARFAILGERKRESRHLGDIERFVENACYGPEMQEDEISFEIKLPDRHADILSMAVNTQMTVDEIADNTGICAQGVRKAMASIAGKIAAERERIERRAAHG